MIAEGQRVAVKDASGRWLEKVALSRPVAGRDFAVVWVAWADDPESEVPWPMEDVVPVEAAPAPVLSHDEYAQSLVGGGN